MHRCNQPVEGRYEVRFEYLDKPYGEPRAAEFVADIGDHVPVYALVDGKEVLVEDIPRASQNQPYVGELCVHELDWLRQIPGFSFARHRRYYVRRLDEAEAAADDAPRPLGARKPKTS